jgi:hypothetical protein
MSRATKSQRKGKGIDVPRANAALAKLDEVVARYPHLTSAESQERLAKHLDEAADEKGDHDGGEEDDRRR